MTRKVIARLKTLISAKKEKETEIIESTKKKVRLRHGVQEMKKEDDYTSECYITNQ